MEKAPSFKEAVSGGTPTANLRLRYETADQSGKESADAATARLRLGYVTGAFYGLQAGVEFETTGAADVDSYNAAGVMGDPEKSVIADPESTEVNQLFLKYVLGESEAIVGRQRIVLDNARFVGDVGWRQNNQTYDALTFKTTALPDTELSYSYVDKVIRIFGSESEGVQNHFTSDSHLLNAKYMGLPVKLAAYAYLLDLENAKALSTDTFGASLSGKTVISETSSLAYYLEGAYQESGDSNPEVYEVYYYHGTLTGSYKKVAGILGYEVLGSDTAESGDNKSFTTPLATLHKFNGWADVFLATPPEGLQDFYVGLSAPLPASMIFKAFYHDFSSDKDSMSYGDEIDLLLVAPVPGIGKAIAKYANYSADEYGVDTERFSIELNIAF